MNKTLDESVDEREDDDDMANEELLAQMDNEGLKQLARQLMEENAALTARNHSLEDAQGQFTQVFTQLNTVTGTAPISPVTISVGVTDPASESGIEPVAEPAVDAANPQ